MVKVTCIDVKGKEHNLQFKIRKRACFVWKFLPGFHIPRWQNVKEFFQNITKKVLQPFLVFFFKKKNFHKPSKMLQEKEGLTFLPNHRPNGDHTIIWTTNKKRTIIRKLHAVYRFFMDRPILQQPSTCNLQIAFTPW